MHAAEKVADYFTLLVERCNRESTCLASFAKCDRTIFYIVATRCEIDINGFASVFHQLLSAEEVEFLINSLRELGAGQLAELFERALGRLKEAGFYENEGGSIEDFRSHEFDLFLESIEQELLVNNDLWDLDDRLATLIPGEVR